RPFRVGQVPRRDLLPVASSSVWVQLISIGLGREAVLLLRRVKTRLALSGHARRVGRCPLMGWTRRAPAPASRIAGSGLQNQEHSMPHNTSRLEAVATIGIDIGKNTFHLVGLDRNGAIVLRQKLSRRQIEARLANTPPCLIGMEACVGAHHLSRQLKAYGHDARLMPARYVRPYSKGQKNDFRDAEAIAEAVLRPTMKFVAVKTVEQLD